MENEYGKRVRVVPRRIPLGSVLILALPWLNPMADCMAARETIAAGSCIAAACCVVTGGGEASFSQCCFYDIPLHFRTATTVEITHSLQCCYYCWFGKGLLSRGIPDSWSSTVLGASNGLASNALAARLRFSPKSRVQQQRLLVMR